MPVENELDVALPDIWIKQSLTAPDPQWLASGGWRAQDYAQVIASSAALVAEFNKRFWSEEGVAPKPSFPYIVWSGRTDPSGSNVLNIRRSFKGRVRAIYDVRRVDNFEAGVGSFSQGRPTYKHLYSCLCGVGETPIRVNGVFLGNIVQARWRNDWKRSYRSTETQALTTELGVTIEITYQNY